MPERDATAIRYDSRAQLAMDGGRTWLLVVGLTVLMIAVYVGLEVADVVL